METQEQNIKDILEAINFIKDNAASKEDLIEVKNDLAGVKEDIAGIKATMATKEELAGIKATMATKEELAGVKQDLALVKVTMATKEDLDDLRQEMKSDFNQLITTVDNYAKKADDYFQEMTVLSHKVNRHEDWIQSLANKLEMNLEY